jgi:O-antigen ligase
MPSRSFRFALALYVLIVVTRLHEAIPYLQPFYLGKIATVFLAIAAWNHLDRAVLRQVLSSKTAKCIGIITLLAIFSVPGSYWPRASVDFLKDQWPLSLLLFVCVAAGFAVPRLGYQLLVCATAGATLAAGQLLVGAGLSVAGRAYVGGGSSSTYDPNDSATLFVMALPFALLISSRPGKFRWAGITAVPILLVALLKTGSRGGVIALGVLFLFMLITGDSRRRKQFLLLAGVFAIAFAIVPHNDLVERFNNVFGTGTDYNLDSRDGRLEIWKRGIGLMLNNPLLGVGVATYEVADGVTAGSWHTAHNAYIQIGAELGVLGFAAFLAAVAYSGKALWRGSRPRASVPNGANRELERQIAVAVLGAFVAVCVCALFLSMAYTAMTVFVLAAATGIGLREATGLAARPGRVPTPSVAIRASGWRTTRSSALHR